MSTQSGVLPAMSIPIIISRNSLLVTRKIWPRTKCLLCKKRINPILFSITSGPSFLSHLNVGVLASKTPQTSTVFWQRCGPHSGCNSAIPTGCLRGAYLEFQVHARLCTTLSFKAAMLLSHRSSVNSFCFIQFRLIEMLPRVLKGDIGDNRAPITFQ